MTSTGVAPGRWEPIADLGRRSNAVRNVLLACGILAPLLYAATDLLGGLRYEGYSFSSQAVSELMATGAPSEAFVDPLFLLFGVLVLLFGIRVVQEGAGRNRDLSVAGILLSIYAVLGFTGPTLFEMYPRGTGESGGDLPHIVVTGIIVLCHLAAIAFGAFAFGRRFRVYSFATLVTVVLFGALAGSYGPEMAAGEPTPGFGIIERICIYASLLWVSVFAVMLGRRSRPSGGHDARASAAFMPNVTVTNRIHGTVAPGFEEVRAEFARNFTERGEIGAAVAVYWRGEKVVDLWGGRRAPEGNDPWNEDTMVVTMSCTKGLAALTMAPYAPWSSDRSMIVRNDLRHRRRARSRA